MQKSIMYSDNYVLWRDIKPHDENLDMHIHSNAKILICQNSRIGLNKKKVGWFEVWFGYIKYVEKNKLYAYECYKQRVSGNKTDTIIEKHQFSIQPGTLWCPLPLDFTCTEVNKYVNDELHPIYSEKFKGFISYYY